MNADQLAMDRFGDFLKLLAQGCHVRIDHYVYWRSGSDIVSSSQLHYDPKQRVGHVINKSVGWWMSVLWNDMEVLYSPIATTPMRHVRKVEL